MIITYFVIKEINTADGKKLLHFFRAFCEMFKIITFV